MPTSERVAEFLLDTGAVRLSAFKPFVSKTGKKSPVYCDYGLIRSHPAASDFIVDALYGRLRGLHIHPDVLASSDVSDSGCAHAVAKKMDLPLLTVHADPSKDSFGDAHKGRQVVMLEDLVFTGAGTAAAVNALRDAGLYVTDVVSILSYALLPMQERAMEGGFMVHPLTTVPEVHDTAVKQDRITASESAEILKFLKDPEHWL